jgi:hypothetical protein
MSVVYFARLKRESRYWSVPLVILIFPILIFVVDDTHIGEGVVKIGNRPPMLHGFVGEALRVPKEA